MAFLTTYKACIFILVFSSSFDIALGLRFTKYRRISFFKFLRTTFFIFVGLVRMISRDARIESLFLFFALTRVMQVTSIVCTTNPIWHAGDLFTKRGRIHTLVPFEIFADSAFKTMFFPSLKNIRIQLFQRHTSEIDMIIFQELFNCIGGMTRKASQLMFQIC